ncbi:DnaD domain protein [Megamonas funiformis]|jgi:DnaD/phage-associated family protein|uniref:DnaD domain protein n=1 Tax=Megamonas funiformis TaxID=437897 RepID=UPI0020535922|nr:DnaD domain protein [Megamonas funiformis]DAN15386.1 MAG TPA: Replication initiation and membrane attachment [Caudoviricetes sp.]
MGKVKDDSNFQIYGWMVTQLKLKGNELLIYAIIYSFSQNNNGDGIFNASTAYLCEWTGLSQRAVINCLIRLIENNLIIKIEDNSLKRKPSVYKINEDKLKLTTEKNSVALLKKVQQLNPTTEKNSVALLKKVQQTTEKSSVYNSTTTINISTTTIEEQLDYICKLYTTEITNRVCCSSIETDTLINFIDMYGVSAIENAIKIAVMRNKRSLGYIEGILKNEARVDNGTDATSTTSGTEKEASVVRQRKAVGRKKVYKASAVETIEQAEAKFANETNDWD